MTCPDGTSVINSSQLATCIEHAEVCIFQTNFKAISPKDKDKIQNIPCILNGAYFDTYGVSYMLLLLCVVDSWCVCVRVARGSMLYCCTFERIA